MRKNLVLLLLLGIVSLSLSGCLVGEGKYMKKVAEAEGLTNDLAALQKRFDDLTLENASLKSAIDKLKEDQTALSADRAKLAAGKKELEVDLKSSQNESLQRISELRQKIGDMENENARLKQEIAGLQKAKVEEVQKTSKTYEQLLDKMKGEIAQGQVTISELKGKLTVNMVDAVLFDSGKAEVKTDGLVVLQKVIDILKNVKDKAIRIEGHTDNVQIVGALTKRYPTNWELSAARAINVARFLQQQGIDPLVLGAVAYSEYKPVAPNDTDEGKAKNRRIEIILVPKD